MKKYLAPMLMATLLAACGGGSSDNGNNQASGQNDSFLAVINARFMAMNDETSEADDTVASIEVTSPENTDPI